MKMRPRLGGDLDVYAQGQNDPYGAGIVVEVRVENRALGVLLDSREAYTFAMSVLKARREVQAVERAQTSPTPTS